MRCWAQLFSPGRAKSWLWSCPTSILCPLGSGLDILPYVKVYLSGEK